MESMDVYGAFEKAASLDNPNAASCFAALFSEFQWSEREKSEW